MIFCAPVTSEGMIDPRWGRADWVALADVVDGEIMSWQVVEVSWSRLHDEGPPGSHHARVVTFLREHDVEAVVVDHMGRRMVSSIRTMPSPMWSTTTASTSCSRRNVTTRAWCEPGGPSSCSRLQETSTTCQLMISPSTTSARATQSARPQRGSIMPSLVTGAQKIMSADYRRCRCPTSDQYRVTPVPRQASPTSGQNRCGGVVDGGELRVGVVLQDTHLARLQPVADPVPVQ